MNGFTFGFQIGCVGVPPQPTSVIRNLHSADTFSSVIDRKITKELALGRILGPYDVMPNYPNYRISPLDVVPKKTLGEFRMIHHLPFPEGYSVNDFIPKEISSVQYATIQDAISFIQRSSQSVYMAKVDVESAFRMMPSPQLIDLCWDFSGSGSSIWMQFYQWTALVLVPFFNVSARL